MRTSTSLSSLQNFTLNNGTKLFFMPLPNQDSSIVMATVKAGPRNDPLEKEGLSHFTEHMLFRGTEKYPSSKELTSVLEKKGALAEAFSYYETNKYWIKCSKENIKLAIENLIERIYKPLIKEADIESEKGVIKEERHILFSNPEKLIWEVWNKALWKKTNLGRIYLGDEKSVQSITRKDVLDHLKRYYIPENITFFVAGNTNGEPVRKSFNSFIRKVPMEKQTTIINTFSKGQVNQRQRFEIVKSDSENVTVALGFSSIPKGHEDEEVLDLISVLLGGGMSSRLRQAIMEPGYTYSIQANTEYISDTGYFVVQFTTSKNLLDRVLDIIYSNILNLTRQPISSSELDLAKGFYAGQMKINTETAYDWAFFYSDQIISNAGKIITMQEKINKINKIDQETLLNVSKKYFRTENFCLAAIGNLNKDDITLFR